MNWFDEYLSSRMNPYIPFEVYTHQSEDVHYIGVRNLTSKIIVHYPGESILYGPADYRDCCEFADDVKDIIFKK